jgi:site-specific recombinase XerD
MLDIQLDSIKTGFAKYLDSLGISAKSHKNYRSDLNHFTAWAILKVKSFGSFAESLSEIVPFLSNDLALDYKSFMGENSYPDKTINRRLSTLRHLSKFLVSSQVVDSDFMSGIDNLSFTKHIKVKTDPIFNEYRAYLESEKISPNTIKNYLSDVRHFLAWLKTNQIINQPTN